MSEWFFTVCGRYILQRSGVDYTVASISITAVSSSSCEKFACPTTLHRYRLVDLIIHSNTPPHQGARSMLNIHWLPRLTRCFWTVSSLKMTTRNLAAALKFHYQIETCVVNLAWLQTASDIAGMFWLINQIQGPNEQLKWLEKRTDKATPYCCHWKICLE